MIESFLSRKGFLRYRWALLLVLVCVASGCRGVRQPVLFRSGEDVRPLREATFQASRNYTIAPHDYVAVSIFANGGAQLVDPNGELAEELPLQQNGQGQQQNMQNLNMILDPSNMTVIFQNDQNPLRYLVDEQGYVQMPKIGRVKLGGLSLVQADSLLAARYSEFLVDPLVFTQYLNKRVILMGALGDRVIPLRNEGMTVLEVLAFAGGFQERGMADRVKLIRDLGSEQGPQIYNVDLTRFETLTQGRVFVQPNDVIYVEPRRRFDSTFLRDIGQALSVVASLLTIYVLAERL